MTPTTCKTARTRGPLLAVVAIVILTTPFRAPAQTADVVSDGQTFKVRYSATLTESDLIFGRVLGYDTVGLPDAGFLGEVGKPMLPAQTLRIALPAGMDARRVRVAGTETVELPGQYNVLPAQPPRRLSDPKTDADFVGPDPETYASSVAYPAETVTFVGQTDLAGQGIAVLRVCPVQYVPADRRLVLCTAIHIVLDGVAGYTCGDYLPQRLSETARQSYERQVAGMVVNPDDVQLRSADGQPPLRGVGPGRYDYVIITPSNWVSAFQPLADWKTKKGIPANIVTTTWIYSNYSGSNVDQIRSFVQDAYNTWGATFFLLGGDTAYVPYHSRTFGSVDPDPVPNDTYYADFDSDWVCEVNVGRASVTTTGTGNGGIGNFINKVLTYEKNPPLTGYAKKAGFFGFDLDGSTHAEQCKATIRNSYVPGSWTMTTVYDSQGGNHWTNVIAAVNAGQNLLNHADHSAWDYLGTGYINHNWGLTTSDVDAFHNGSKQGIFYSMGCDPAAYDYDDCIAEHFVRNTNGGGVAFIGNSRYGWYSTGSYNTYSMRYDQYFFRSLFAHNLYKLGAAFSDHKNDAYANDDYYKYIYTELTLLGDPELPIWTEDPLSLTVTHDATLNVGQHTNFPVQVNSGAGPVAGATVCLWKPNDVYTIAQSNTSGTATFDFTPNSVGTLNVTVSGHNYLPHEDSAQVVQGSVDLLPDGFTVVRGQLVSGGLSDLFYSDDLRLYVRNGATLNTSEPPVWLVITGTSLTVTPSALKFTLEAKVDIPGSITQKIELFNYVTQAYELVDTRNATTSDSVAQVVLTGDLSRFVDASTKAMKAQLTWKPSGPLVSSVWVIGIDQSIWTETP